MPIKEVRRREERFFSPSLRGCRVPQIKRWRWRRGVVADVPSTEKLSVFSVSSAGDNLLFLLLLLLLLLSYITCKDVLSSRLLCFLLVKSYLSAPKFPGERRLSSSSSSNLRKWRHIPTSCWPIELFWPRPLLQSGGGVSPPPSYYSDYWTVELPFLS